MKQRTDIEILSDNKKIAAIIELTRVRLSREVERGGLSSQDLQVIFENGGLYAEQAYQMALRIANSAKLVDSALLEPVGIVSVRGLKKFVASEKFLIGTQDGVVIGWIGDNFRKYFLPKVELNTPAQKLRIHKLRIASLDPPIITELGGQEIVETQLAIMWQKLKKQGAGQPGDLDVTGKANIFYIRDILGSLWAVFCHWSSNDRYWVVEASPLADSSKWYAGFLVFSR